MTGRIFIVEIEHLKKAVIIKSMLDDLGIGKDPTVEVDDDVIPLPNLTEKCMEKLLEWCTYHKDDVDVPDTDGFNFKDEISDWDLDFLKMDDATLFDLILAANYLDIKGLLDITTTYVARIITDLRTPDDIRKRFNIKNDLSPEDLEQIKKEADTWLMDDEDDRPTDPAMTPSTSTSGAAQEAMVTEGPAVGGGDESGAGGAEGGAME